MFLTPAPLVPISLCYRLALILESLCQAAAARCAEDRSFPTLVLVLQAWERLHHLAVRFETLVAKLRAGRLPAASVVRRQAPPSPQRDGLPGLPQRDQLPPLPRGFGWLLRLVPEAAAYAGQVEDLLARPDTPALLAASPQAGGILRPLCHMLAIKPGPALCPPPRPRRQASPEAAVPAADPSRAADPSPAASRPVASLSLAGLSPDLPPRIAAVLALALGQADPPPGLPAPA